MLLVAAVLLAGLATGSAYPMRDTMLGLNEVDWHIENTGVYYGSPSLVRLDAETLLVSHDYFGFGTSSPWNVSVHISTDNGMNWAFSGFAVSQYWSNLFTLPGKAGEVYLMGTDGSGPSRIKLAVSKDRGTSWTGSVLFNLTASGGIGYETGPTPALVSNGRVYRALEAMNAPGKWGRDFAAVVCSASLDADLMDPASWTITPSQPFNTSWLPASYPTLINPGFLEGNMVEAPDGTLYDILRFNSEPVIGNKAVALRYDNASNTLEFDRIFDLPGGHTKFVIRRDPETGLYFTLSNNNTIPAWLDQRNLLHLCVSSNLFDWTIIGVLLYDDTGFAVADSVRYTGFHYVDHRLDGDHIMYAVRTAYRGAQSYHDSNRITTKVLPNFRRYVQPGAGVTLGGSNYTVRALHAGAVAFSDRAYTWAGLPDLFATPQFGSKGWNFTQLAGGADPGSEVVTVSTVSSGMVYAANDGPAVPPLLAAGFTKDVIMALNYTTSPHPTSLTVLGRYCAEGDTFTVPQAGWSGTVLLFATH